MIHTGRYFAWQEEAFVVFILGMRIHQPRKVAQWLRLYQLIPKMLTEIEHNPPLGYLGSIAKVSFREPLIIQYWRDLKSLEHFARNPENSHLEVWKTFNRWVGKSKDIGIWHESYCIQPHQHENIYINMPYTGLGQFTPLRPVQHTSNQYQQRFKQ